MARLTLPAYHLGVSVGYLNVGPDFRSVGAQSKDIDYSATPIYFDRYTNNQILRPLSIMDVVRDESIYKSSVTSRLMTGNPLYNQVLPYGIATFNVQGIRGGIEYSHPAGFSILLDHFHLSEIRGQGTFTLKQMIMTKLFARVDLGKLTGFSRRFILQAGGNYQTTARKSDVDVETVDLKTMQFQGGIEFEFIKKMDLLLGLIGCNTKGNDFSPVRNEFSTIDYFIPVNYDLSQMMPAAGLRFRFLDDRIYLSGIYQTTTWKDRLKLTADYKMDQFALIFNMTF
jgi:hypothetical protein